MRESNPFSFVGVIHLLALPAAPRGSGGFEAVRARALADAEVLATGGVTGAILENFGDAPFAKGPVDPHVIAAMALLVAEVRRNHPALQIGVNVLRNDVKAALGIAATAGAHWVRANVLAGAAVTDQGVIEGEAHQWLRYRRELGAEKVLLLADVHVKHARPLGNGPIGEAAADLAHRAGADVLIVTGRATGAAAAEEDVVAVREAAPDVPLWLGSGVDHASALRWRRIVDGAIIGTALHLNGNVRAPLDGERVSRMVAALRD